VRKIENVAVFAGMSECPEGRKTARGNLGQPGLAADYYTAEPAIFYKNRRLSADFYALLSSDLLEFFRGPLEVVDQAWTVAQVQSKVAAVSLNLEDSEEL
jgi:hypothetical protein